jgi:hypothetical protein
MNKKVCGRNKSWPNRGTMLVFTWRLRWATKLSEYVVPRPSLEKTPPGPLIHRHCEICPAVYVPCIIETSWSVICSFVYLPICSLHSVTCVSDHTALIGRMITNNEFKIIWKYGVGTGKATGYRLHDREVGVRASIWSRMFCTSSRAALEPSLTPIQWVRGGRVKREGREAHHSPPTSAEVKKIWTYTATPPYAFIA